MRGFAKHSFKRRTVPRIESLCSTSSQTSSEMSESSCAERSSRHGTVGSGYHGLDFQLIIENKSGNGPGKVVHLVAPSMQDKAAWISDISQVQFFRLQGDFAPKQRSTHLTPN